MNPAYRLLYAEDNPQDAELTRTHFAECAPDFGIEIVDTGQACLDRLPASGCDVLLLDHHLPDMEGLDLLRAVVRRGSAVPVVLVTGMGDEELVVKALRLGASFYVPKAGNYLETLPELLRGVVREHRLKQSQGLLADAPRRVLYVEHTTMDIDLTRRYFAEAAPRMELDVISSCAEALVRLGRPPAYDAVLIDLRMPGQSGVDFVREARRRGLPLPPFIMISGQGDEEAAIASLRLGAADYVAKRPGYLEQLTYTIDRAIAHDRLDHLNAQLRDELTRRTRVEEALRESEVRLRSIFAGIDDALFVHDRDGRILDCNEAACRRLGYTREELVGMRTSDIDAPEFAEGFRSRLASQLEARRFSCEGVHVTRDGRRVPVDINSCVIVYNGSEAVLSVMRDITARKQIEEALRFQKVLLESQSEASIDGILNVDAGGKIVWTNRRFSELWGVPQALLRAGNDEAVLKTMLDKLVDPDRFLGDFRDRRAPPDARSRDEIRLKDGRVFDRYSGPVADEEGHHLGRIWLFRDVTDERGLQASVAQADRLASMGLLAAGVAHEINNPLSYVLYNLESLAEDLSRHAAHLAQVRGALAGHLGATGLRDLLGNNVEALDPARFADMQERFKDALTGTRQIRGIARGLGTFSRVESDTLAPVDIRYSIESALHIALNEIKYRARVVSDLNATAPVLASDGRLSQVFLNLLVNAAHAIPEGDLEHNRIGVRLWQEGDSVLAEVEDTGCGIPMENLQRIFEPFFTTKPVGIGSGLGLNIVRNIITAYGGTITVTSEVGKGTRFVVTLPAAKVEAAGPETITDERKTAGASGRVLIIDDEPGIRRALKRLLRRHEVVEAATGEQGRDVLAKDQGFDVILCDMMMPGVSGIDVHKWLIQHHPQLARKVVFVTGGAFTPNARDYLEKVDNLRIEKPFDATNLIKMVAEWVAASRSKA